MSHLILVLNPGSTSTKAAVYQDEQPVCSTSILHTNQDLAPFPALTDQLDYRVSLVRKWLEEESFDLTTLSAVVGRGGIIPNIVAGGYRVDDALVDCLLHHTVFDHASNLGGLMARAFADPLGVPAYIYDAVTSDELLPERSGEKGPASSATESMIRPRLWAEMEMPPPRWATTRFMSS